MERDSRGEKWRTWQPQQKTGHVSLRPGVSLPLCPEASSQFSEELWGGDGQGRAGAGEGLAWGTETRLQGLGSGPDTRAGSRHPPPLELHVYSKKVFDSPSDGCLCPQNCPLPYLIQSVLDTPWAVSRAGWLCVCREVGWSSPPFPAQTPWWAKGQDHRPLLCNEA